MGKKMTRAEWEKIVRAEELQHEHKAWKKWETMQLQQKGKQFSSFSLDLLVIICVIDLIMSVVFAHLFLVWMIRGWMQ